MKDSDKDKSHFWLELLIITQSNNSHFKYLKPFLEADWKNFVIKKLGIFKYLTLLSDLLT